MNLTSFYPVLGTSKIQESRDFYLRHLPFTMTFESDWYVSLKSHGANRQAGSFELALLNYTHESVPEAFRKATQGLIINIETDNVDHVYVHFMNAGLPIHQEIKSEEWGQRHFISSDPNGILLDIIQIIPPSEAFATQYVNAQ